MSAVDGLSDEDFAAVLAYLDGELDERERFRFEDRLSADSGLAESFHSIAELDLIQRVVAEAERAKRGRVFPFRHLATAAAAALCLAAGLWIRSLASRSLADPGVLIASAADMRGFAELTGGDPEWLPDQVRGGSSSGLTPQEVVDYARDREDDLIRKALDAGREELEDVRYRIAFRANADCYAVIVQLSEREGAKRIFPDGEESGRTERPLAGGQDHVLPSRSVVLDGEGEQVTHDFRPGFVLRQGVSEASILLGLREVPLGDELGTELDQLLVDLPAQSETAGADLDGRAHFVQEWLEERGFQVQRFKVVDPDGH